MTHDWTKDVKKYVTNPDEAAIKGIIKHCGIALQSKDASFVACTDKVERDRVRDSFLKKKLALGGSDAELDQAVMDVCQKMHADRDKSRVAFYYLLAEKYGKLAAFYRASGLPAGLAKLEERGGMKKPTNPSRRRKMPDLRTLEILIGKKSEWAIISAEPQRPLTEEEAQKIIQQLTGGQYEDGPPHSGIKTPEQ